MKQDTAIFLRLPQEDYNTVTHIKELYGFKSNAQFVKTAVKVILKIYKQSHQEKQETFEEEIEEYFKELENGEKCFEWDKPKRKVIYATLDDFTR